ncbi:MAG: DUF4301 family protein [Deltaproteobacteria bacterium]|nr:DUF4301 family protein [Deltaproteobacteria bacterium]
MSRISELNGEYKFSELDRLELERHQIPLEEAQRQLKLLREPHRFLKIERACAVGDGISRFRSEETGYLLSLHEQAATRGRLQKFVPASGAASRMFRDLLKVLDDSCAPAYEELRSGKNEDSRFVCDFLSNLPRFAFFDELLRAAGRSPDDLDSLLAGKGYVELLKLLLTEDGLNYAHLPKAHLLFHRYSDGESRTAFEEHLVEAALTVKSSDGLCRLHFTISPEHAEGYQRLIERVRRKYEERFNCRFDVTLSMQKLSTNTLSIQPDGLPFHDERGVLLLRPAGHGALIENLHDLQGDIVFIKNIDNVQRDRDREDCLLYKKLLCGKLIELQSGVHRHLTLLEQQSDETICWQAEEFAAGQLGIKLPSKLIDLAGKRAALLRILNAPIRVCGVVPNTGEPGGGPFWVQSEEGYMAPQIVESAQLDLQDDEQRKRFENSTHFNPVDIVCAVRDHNGRPFDLHAYIDSRAIIRTVKSHGGRDLISCERPGLWNGAMAGWITVFMEVPVETFTPVKTVNDLLRSSHRPD